jgi:ribosome biogenesis GTPase
MTENDLTAPDLAAYGWSDRWQATFAEHGDAGRRPGRVVRHDGSALAVATGGAIRQVPWRTSVGATTVGDWVVLDATDDVVVDVLPRASLLERRDPMGGDQLLAANVDVVGVVCGLDRPVRGGRIERTVALAWDAGAVPLLVLTKLDATAEPGAVVADAATLAPGVDVVATSSAEGRGIAELRDRLAGRTAVLVGESGAGKSTLVNTLVGDVVTLTGAVRGGDAKGRHTTSFRQLHLLPGGGVLIDTPGLRSVGLLGGVEAVDEAFPEIDELAAGCRFRDCRHEGEPGCAVAAAVAAGDLPAERMAAWAKLRREAVAEDRRADEHRRRQYERGGSRVAREAQERKGR